MKGDTAAGLQPVGRHPTETLRRGVLCKHVARRLRQGTLSLFVDLSDATAAATAEIIGSRLPEVNSADVQRTYPKVALELNAYADRGFLVDDDEALWRYIGGRYSAVEVGLGDDAWLWCHELDGRDYWINSEGIMSPPVPTKTSSRVRRVKQFIRWCDGGVIGHDDDPDEFDAGLHTLRGLPPPVVREIRQARLRGWRRQPTASSSTRR